MPRNVADQGASVCWLWAGLWEQVRDLLNQDVFFFQGSHIKGSLVSTGAEFLSCATWIRVPEFAL